MAFFTSIADTRQKLASTGYLVDESLATVVFLGDSMGKPILLEGPAGTGKSYLAVALAVQALLAKEVHRIILTRPAVEAGERLGFLPGPDVVDLSGPLAG